MNICSRFQAARRNCFTSNSSSTSRGLKASALECGRRHGKSSYSYKHRMQRMIRLVCFCMTKSVLLKRCRLRALRTPSCKWTAQERHNSALIAVDNFERNLFSRATPGSTSGTHRICDTGKTLVELLYWLSRHLRSHIFGGRCSLLDGSIT